MGTALLKTEDQSTTGDAKLPPFAREWVTLTKQEHTQLVWEANYWKSAHQRANARIQEIEARHKLEIEQAATREAALRSELEAAQAKVRDLRKRVFGRKSEHSSHEDNTREPDKKTSRPRGQQRGAPGHGRTTHEHLPAHHEIIGIDLPQCSCCGLDYADFPGTEDSEVLEIEVKAHRRVIHRKRYRKTCQCKSAPGIITAPPPARLIPKGKYGISVWVHLLLSKFLYGQPTHRLLQDLADLGLNLSAGTLTGGLQTLAPLFEPLAAALLAKLRSESHWHADETRWMVFAEVEGKSGYRWYLWLFQSKSVVHFVLDPSRSANVPIEELVGELEKVLGGILSCDRYSAYKKFARLYPQFILAFCWAHQRRDFLELAISHPDLSAWAFVWVDKIGELYHLNDLRLKALPGSVEFAECDQSLRQAVEQMAGDRDAALKDPSLEEPAVKVLQSMENHWSGLTVFVEHPEVPMDNNTGERTLRTPVTGRKNYYGSGSQWSGELAAIMFSLFMTLKLWDINSRTWLSAFLHACAANGNKAPGDLSAFLPWEMNEARLAMMKRVAAAPDPPDQKEINTS